MPYNPEYRRAHYLKNKKPRPCPTCGKIMPAGKHYCSRECKPGVVVYTCDLCGKKATQAAASFRLKERHYCSHKCAGEVISKDRIKNRACSKCGSELSKKERSLYAGAANSNKYPLCLSCRKGLNPCPKCGSDKIRTIDPRHWCYRCRRSFPKEWASVLHAIYSKIPKNRLRTAISGALRASIRTGKGGKKTFDLLGYSLKKLMRHIERLFQPGMTWENYGKWHIDHIIPISKFNIETYESPDFKRAWALSNLQPLWASDNQRKNNKLSAPFQPSLAI